MNLIHARFFMCYTQKNLKPNRHPHQMALQC